jgi:membrane fusion protein (multidrug efflux system)
MSEESTPGKETCPVSKKRKRPSRRMAFVIGVALLCGLAWRGVPMYRYALTHESTDNAFIESHVVPLSPRVAGHVDKVLVEDNQLVHAGELLVEIDPRNFQAALDAALAAERAARAEVNEAEAQAEAAESQLEYAQADLASQQASLAQVRADMSQARAEHARDTVDLERIRSIAESGAVSRQTLDHSVAAEAISQAKLKSAGRLVETHGARILQARSAIDAAHDALREAQARVEVKQADLHQAMAETEQARLNLSYTSISAPCDGRVTKKSVETGAYVQVGQGLMSVVNSEVWVVANFKETQISRMRPGQPVDIEVDAYPGRVFHGRVDSLQHGTGSRFSLLPPENSSGNFIKVVQRVPVKIVFDQRDLDGVLLTPGMSTVPEVDVAAAETPGVPVAAATRP